MLWRRKLEAQEGPFVLAFNSNLDPFDGEGQTETMRDFLSDPIVQDPQPTSLGAAEVASTNHIGPAALDTVDWPDPSPGNLRVSYVLPSRHWRVEAAGVFWPSASDPDHALIASDQAGAHRLVWVDLSLLVDHMD